MYKYAYGTYIMLTAVRLKSVYGTLHLSPSDCLGQKAVFSLGKLILYKWFLYIYISWFIKKNN